MKATATSSPRCSRPWRGSTSIPGTTSVSSRVSARPRRASRAFRRGARWVASFARARRASRSWRRSSADARLSPTATTREPSVGFRAAYVFDVEQTDGEPLPTPVEASGDPGAKTAAAQDGDPRTGHRHRVRRRTWRRTRHVKRRMHSAPQRSLARHGVHDSRSRVRARTVAPRRRPTGLTRHARTRSGGRGLRRRRGSRDSTRLTHHATTSMLYRGDREALSGSLDRIQRAASVILTAVSVGG